MCHNAPSPYCQVAPSIFSCFSEDDTFSLLKEGRSKEGLCKRTPLCPAHSCILFHFSQHFTLFHLCRSVGGTSGIERLSKIISMHLEENAKLKTQIIRTISENKDNCSPDLSSVTRQSILLSLTYCFLNVYSVYFAKFMTKTKFSSFACVSDKQTLQATWKISIILMNKMVLACNTD